MGSATIQDKATKSTSQRNLEAFYEPNLRMAGVHRFNAYNAGYAEAIDSPGSFDQHQQDLVFRLLGDAPIGPESTVLDVGCGIGGPSTWIFERCQPAKLVGMDFCETSIRVANERWEGRSPRPVFTRGDAHRLPMPDDSVDVIFNLESALHYADKHTFLAECRRVLKPGGLLCLGDFCTKYKRLFAALGRLDFLQTQFTTYARLWKPDDYLGAFAQLGFETLRHEEVSIQAANSLHGGLKEVSDRGWKAARGFRGRFFYLTVVKQLLRYGWLGYDLFAVRKP